MMMTMMIVDHETLSLKEMCPNNLIDMQVFAPQIIIFMTTENKMKRLQILQKPYLILSFLNKGIIRDLHLSYRLHFV